MKKEQLEKRFQALNTELKKGERKLQALEQERILTEKSMLRIEGAVQLIRELLDDEETEQTQQTDISEVHISENRVSAI